jgi:hypothetical protein
MLLDLQFTDLYRYKSLTETVFLHLIVTHSARAPNRKHELEVAK